MVENYSCCWTKFDQHFFDFSHQIVVADLLSALKKPHYSALDGVLPLNNYLVLYLLLFFENGIF